jgi:tetratricopeptide (TPR) repeat protein
MELAQKTRLAALLALSLVLRPAEAQRPDPWIGQRIITKFGAVLRVDNQIVDNQKRAGRARGGERAQARVYRVERTNGSLLWVVPEQAGASGWVQVSDVIPFDQAIDYFTNEIRTNPKNAAAFIDRGNLRSQKGEFDNAISDYNEAIRLDPKNEVAYGNRGIAWKNKQEYDKAIADYSEAIRLDPTDVDPYYNRGIAWKAKQENDKAIADYNEAIRLDPKYALAYNNRGNAWNAKNEYDKAIRDFSEAIRLDPKFAFA